MLYKSIWLSTIAAFSQNSRTKSFRVGRSTTSVYRSNIRTMVATRQSLKRSLAATTETVEQCDGAVSIDNTVKERKTKSTTLTTSTPKRKRTTNKTKKPATPNLTSEESINQPIILKESIKAPSTSLDPKPLLTLPSDCVEAVLQCRPSKRNKSPYVADVFVPSLNREAICHVPNLDMGGKCRPGVTLWIKPQRDKKGHLLGPNAVNPKYNTPKCEFVAQLLLVDEQAISPNYPPVWVGAHPSLGEAIAEEVITRHVDKGSGLPGMGSIESFQKQVTISSHSRADFVLQPTSGRPRIVEIKTVVDTDYNPEWGLPDPSAVKCVFAVPEGAPHAKYGIFPWGQSNQKGPDGEKVVSARAIKHVAELTELVKKGTYDATVLFIVIRHDAQGFRPNYHACPSFAKYLHKAQQAGVQILAKQVQWGDGKGDGVMGQCVDRGFIDVDFFGPTDKKPA